MERQRLCRALLCTIAFVPLAGAAQITEGFDNIATLTGSGWTQVNNSTAPPSSSWFQGDPNIFPSQSGAANSYIGANFLAAALPGNISLWLITPVVTLDNGVSLTFYTRTENPQVAADRLEVRSSTNGASSNVGANDTTVGDFTNLLLTINPTLAANGYPGSWSQFTATISGLGGPVSGRFAFRYFVTDTSTNADYIGIDSVSVSSTGTVPEPSSIGLGLLGLAGVSALAARRRRSA